MIQNPSHFQKNIFKTLPETNHNMVVEATAGSGKSSTIIACAELLPPSVQACFLAFNKTIVEHLKTKLPSYTTCKTAHSIGFSALINYHKIQFKLNPLKSLSFVDRILKEKIKDEKKLVITKFQMLDVIDLMRMNFLSPSIENINTICFRHNINLGAEFYPQVVEAMVALERYNRSFTKKYNQVDFTDMITLALNPKIRLPQFDIVFIDECQDFNKAQQQLVLRLLKPNGRLIAVGDQNQAIYGFAGADGNSFQFFKDRPNTVSLPLSISYRCGLEIVKNAQIINPGIEPYEKNHVGEVREGSLEEICDDDIVICRNSKPLVFAYLSLLGRGQGAMIVGKDIENNLMKTLSYIINCDKVEGIEKLEEMKLELATSLRAKGIKNLNYNQQYGEFCDQVSVMKVLAGDVIHMSQIEDKIHDMFISRDNVTRLMTIHKSKGLENDRVFLITHFEDKALMPSEYAKSDWEIRAERNIQFVALTRAVHSLITVKL